MRTKRRGRPPLPPEEAKRNQIAFRATAALKSKIMAAVEKSGRSQAHEVELRLEKSFWLDELIACEMAKRID